MTKKDEDDIAEYVEKMISENSTMLEEEFSLIAEASGTQALAIMLSVLDPKRSANDCLEEAERLFQRDKERFSIECAKSQLEKRLGRRAGTYRPKVDEAAERVAVLKGPKYRDAISRMLREVVVGENMKQKKERLERFFRSLTLFDRTAILDEEVWPLFVQHYAAWWKVERGRINAANARLRHSLKK